MMMSRSLIHLPPAHHSHPPSRIHYFIPGSTLNIFHHSLLAPSRTALSDYSRPDILCSTVFHFRLFFFLFCFGLYRRLIWLNCQLSSTLFNIGSLHYSS